MKHKFNFFILTVIVVFFAMAADVFIVYQLNNYETRFLEIYGGEQDGYVKIILEQINRLDNEGTDEDITDIISSLDSTASRYWTLSKGDSILFVKSVTETNRYKGFHDGTYYATETASAFMNSLGVNQVGHRIIYLDNDRFIASGMIFEWQGEQYRICLLTYDRVILEDNVLLECRNAIIIILSIVLALLIILSMIMSKRITRQSLYIDRQEERVVWQNQQIELLDEQLKREYAFSASKHVFKSSVLDEFLETLEPESYLYYKLSDIRTVYEGFEDYLADKYITKEELLDVLSELVPESALLKNSVVVLDGFTGFTPIQTRVIGELMRLCGEVIVTLTMGAEEDPYQPDGEQRLF